MLGSSEKKILQGIIIIACWCIWLARNKAVFSSSRVSVEDIFSDLRSMGFFWLKYRSSFQSIAWNDSCKSVFM
ncbi:hypothetical protein HanRHA438_Chr14g0649821 [Helianthus annuus]|nr:hypothetical protein HanRHA438_Chr14g0649821 [Helianthus annuus]